MAQFAILMREDDDAWSKLPQAEQQRLMRLYGTWVGDLRAMGAFVDGTPLGGPARILRNAGGRIVDEPLTDSKRALTGWFVVEAADMDGATMLARGCPALLHGETVEVRPLGHG